MRVSPSQVHAFDLCPRKWAFKVIEGKSEPQSSAQAEGQAAHARVERHLRTGEDPGQDELGKLIQAGRRPGHLPIPGSHLLLEHEMEIPLAGGPHTFYGFIDCVVPPIDGRAIVIDHKFVGSFKYIKTEDDLRTDPQAVGYGKAACAIFPRALEVERRWLNFQKKSQKVKPVSIVGTRAQIEEAWAPLERKALDMIALRQKAVSAEELEGNPEACASFGGCAFKRFCSVGSRVGSFGALVQAQGASSADAQGGATVMGLLDQLNKIKAAQGAEAQGTQGAEAQGTQGAETQSEAAKPTPIEAEKPAPAEKAPPAEEEKSEGAKPATPKRGASALAALQAARGAKGINPPESAQAQTPAAKPSEAPLPLEAVAATNAKLEDLAKAQREDADRKGQARKFTAEDVQVAYDAIAKEATREEEERKQAELAKRLEQAARVAILKEMQREEPTQEAPKPAAKQLPPPSQPKGEHRSQLTVLFNAAVVKRPGDASDPVQLVELLAPIMREVADSANKAHWLLIPFNDGKALLAHAFDKWLTEAQWKGTILVDTASEEARAVREVLLAHADVIVRGLA